MGEVKNRSVRLDDENYGWLTGLPGRSLNEAVERLRVGGVKCPETSDGSSFIAEILELVRGLPDAEDIEGTLRRVIQEFKGQKGSGAVVGRTLEPAQAFEGRKDGHCVHCGEDFELMPGAPPSSICRKCVVGGHRTGMDCRKCAEREHWAKKAAKDSICDDSNVDYSAFND